MRFNKRNLVNVSVFIIIFFGFSYFLFKVVNFEIILQKIGIFKYILIPFISVFGSNTITSSFLYPILFFLKQTGANLFLLIILAAAGGIVGDLIFVIFGKRLSDSTDKKSEGRVFEFFRKKQNSPYLGVFIFLYAAFFPMPNEAMTFVLGYLRYPVKKIVFPLSLGNVLYYSLLVSIGGGIWEMIF
jgi:membrane protein YqaA with SNARE-associated domain